MIKKQFGFRKPYDRNRRDGKYRKNDRIRSPEVRVIGPDGNQIGVLPTAKALEMAKAAGLDLVEVSPTARPPVCRILEYGKFLYEEEKKNKQPKQPGTKLKEIKFRVNIDPHDYATKIKHGEGFLWKGYKLKLSMFFRGREMERRSGGLEIMNKAIEDLKQVGVPDAQPRFAGSNLSLTFTPLPANKRKLIFNVKETFDNEEDADEDEATGGAA